MPDFTFKIQPAAGETIDAWMERAYAPDARGPDNRVEKAHVVYAPLTEAEFSVVVDEAGVPPIVWDGLLLADNPTAFVSPQAPRTHAVLAFDLTGHALERVEAVLGGVRIKTPAPALKDLLAAWVRPSAGGEPVMLDETAIGYLREAPSPGPAI